MDRDFHIHTFFSPCAAPTMSLDTIIETALAAGLKDVGLTDHPFHDGLFHHHEALAHALAGRGKMPLRVWIGAELEVLGPEQLVIPAARLSRAEYLIAAPSHYDFEHFPPVPHLEDPMEWADRMLTDVENVIGSGAHIIAHPFHVHEFVASAGGHWHLPPLAAVFAEMRPRRLENLLDRLAEDRIALEISPRVAAHPALEAFLEDLYRKALRRGIKFSLGSDSHRPQTIGQLRGAADFVRRLGIGEEHLWHPARDIVKSAVAS